MKKLLATILMFAMISSLLCGMTVFAEAAADGTYEISVTVTGDTCLNLAGETINPWENAKLQYTVKEGVIQDQAYLVNDYYQIGYWPKTSQARGVKTFAYTSEDYYGMDVVIPSGVGAYTLAAGFDQEIAYAAVNAISFTGVRSDGGSNDNNSMFNGSTVWKKIIISEGITTIGYGAIAKPQPAEITVVFPSTATSFGQRIFSGSSSTKTRSVILEGYLPALPSNFFASNTKLTSIDLSGLNNFATLSTGLTGVTDLKTLKLPASLTAISSGALSGFANLTDVQIPEENTAYKVENGAVYSKDGKELVAWLRTKATGDVVIPTGVTEIAGSAFLKCTDMTSIVIPETVTFIGQSALENCTSLTTINGSSDYYNLDFVTEVGQYTFRYSAALSGTMVLGIDNIKQHMFTDTMISKVIFINDISAINGNSATFTSDAGQMEVVFLGNNTANTKTRVFTNTVYYPADVNATYYTGERSYFKAEADMRPYAGYIDTASINGDSATVKFATIDSVNEKKALLAFYATEGDKEVLVKVKSVIPASGNIITETVTGVTGAEKVKLYTWNSLSTVVPIAGMATAEYSFNPEVPGE